MANVLHGGFKYWGSVFGQNIVPNVFWMQVASAYGTSLFIGDPVKKVSDGTVARSEVGDPIWGVISACRYLDADGKYRLRNFVPSGTTYTPDRYRTQVGVIMATPFTIFEVDADDASTLSSIATARTLVDENCDHIFTAAGNTGTGLSGCQLDISDHKTASAQWRIFGFTDPFATGTNEVAAIGTKTLVIANETHNWPGTFSTTGI